MDETAELIEQLKNLRLREKQIRKEETEIINRLEEINNNRRANETSQPKTNARRHTFEEGDRVQITNKHKASSPSTRRTNEGDKLATVTGTHTNNDGEVDKVYILTDNV